MIKNPKEIWMAESFFKSSDAAWYAKIMRKKGYKVKTEIRHGRHFVHILVSPKKKSRRNAHISGGRYIAGTPKKRFPGQRAIPAGRGRKVQNTARRLNPPGSRKIGDRVTKIKTTKGTFTPPGECPIYGLKDGSVFIRGFFTNPPPGYVEEIWYMADGKAKREGYKKLGIPWKHDVKAKTILEKTRGGLIMRRGKKPLWGMR